MDTSETIIDLTKLAHKSEMTNSDLILAILEICTYNKKYNYDCSNNTKAFWDRVVEEEVLKRIFKSFKSETLRKYWKIIRLAGNNEKYVETVKANSEFINNPVFKLLPIINATTAYIQGDEKDFEKFISSYNSKQKASKAEEKEAKEENKNKEKNKSKSETKLIGNKRSGDRENAPLTSTNKKNGELKRMGNNISKKEKNNKVQPLSPEESDQQMLILDGIINDLMKITKKSREEVFIALYGTSYNIEQAYLYLTDNEKHEKFFFVKTDDYILKNCRDKGYYQDLINNKGEALVKQREKFLGVIQ